MNKLERAMQIFEELEENIRWWEHAQETVNLANAMTAQANHPRRYKRDVHRLHSV